MSPDSTDDFGVPSVEPTGDAPVFLSRREARAAREAAEKSGASAVTTAPAVSAKAVEADVALERAIPEIPLAPAEVAGETPAVVIAAAAPAEGATPSMAAARPLVAARKRVAAPVKRVRKNPLRAMASMAVVGGLLAVVGLPAYGQGGLVADDSSMASLAAVADVAPTSIQSLTVSAELSAPTLKRDQFAATSPEDLEMIRQQAAIASANALYAASGARELGDDYPWPTAGDTLSPLNYYYRQCTDFVAWRLNRDVGSFSAPFRWAWADLTPNGGDAYQWRSAWESHGWTVSSTPVAGSVAWFGWDNHVSYVKQVNADGSVLIEEYNYVYRAYGQRTLAPSEVEAFLYPPGQ